MLMTRNIFIAISLKNRYQPMKIIINIIIISLNSLTSTLVPKEVNYVLSGQMFQQKLNLANII